MTKKKQFIFTILLMVFFLFLYAFLISLSIMSAYKNKSIPESGDQRTLNAILARTQDYNAAILGTSMSENFACSDIDSALNCRSFKFCKSGSPMRNSRFYWEYLLKLKKTDIFICDLTAGAIPFKEKDFLDPGIPVETYEPNMDHLTIFLTPKLLFSEFSIKQASYYLRPQIEKKYDHQKRRDLLYAWYPTHPCNIKALANSFPLKNNYDFSIDPTIDSSFFAENLHENLIRSVELTPLDAKIYLFFPPYNIMCYTPKRLKIELFLKKEIVSALEKYPHVKIFDFQQEESIIKNHYIYKDMTHYNEKINSWMAQQFANDKYIINMSNLDSIIEQQQNMVKSYDFESALEILKKAIDD